MNERLKYLFERYFNQTITNDERSELFVLIEQTGEKDSVMQMIDWSWNLFDGNGPDVIPQERLNVIFNGIVGEEQIMSNRPVHRVHLLRRGWFRYAAAILLLVIGASLYYIFSHTSQPETAVVQHVPPASGNDVLPGFNRAVLTLSNGQKVELDSGATETIKDGTLSIENNNGVLSYSAMPSAPHTRRAAPLNAPAEGIAYNTMATPRGGQYQLTLADGTKVWLNAASSITYPTAFAGATREVTITGEAYFEVAKNKEKPFIVKTPSDEITVLGTAFNVNAYADETAKKTSLIEGSVSVRPAFAKASAGEAKILQPGQAYLNGKVVTTNVQQDIAWKNGFFSFEQDDIKTVMRQLSRWYDVEVEYQGAVPSGTFNGRIGRSLTLAQVLKILSNVRINYKIENKKLIILPNP